MMSKLALSNALITSATSQRVAGAPGLFEPLIGSWTLEFAGESIDGVAATSRGTMTMDRVLDGRAVQDVWMMPHPDPAEPPLFHGTTVRFYDPAITAWRSTWVEPVHGHVITFIGRAHEGDIVLSSTNRPQPVRWTFTNIRHSSFMWLGAKTSNEGQTWTQYVRMNGKRVPASNTTLIKWRRHPAK